MDLSVDLFFLSISDDQLTDDDDQERTRACIRELDCAQMIDDNNRLETLFNRDASTGCSSTFSPRLFRILILSSLAEDQLVFSFSLSSSSSSCANVQLREDRPISATMFFQYHQRHILGTVITYTLPARRRRREGEEEEEEHI